MSSKIPFSPPPKENLKKFAHVGRDVCLSNLTYLIYREGLDISAIDDFTFEPTEMTTLTSSHLVSVAASHDGMGVVATAAVAIGLEWLSTLIPIILLIILSVCCYRKKQQNKSSQTDEMIEMAVVPPKPVAVVSGQVRGVTTVIDIETK